MVSEDLKEIEKHYSYKSLMELTSNNIKNAINTKIQELSKTSMPFCSIKLDEKNQIIKNKGCIIDNKNTTIISGRNNDFSLLFNHNSSLSIKSDTLTKIHLYKNFAITFWLKLPFLNIKQ